MSPVLTEGREGGREGGRGRERESQPGPPYEQLYHLNTVLKKLREGEREREPGPPYEQLYHLNAVLKKLREGGREGGREPGPAHKCTNY